MLLSLLKCPYRGPQRYSKSKMDDQSTLRSPNSSYVHAAELLSLPEHTRWEIALLDEMEITLPKIVTGAAELCWGAEANATSGGDPMVTKAMLLKAQRLDPGSEFIARKLSQTMTT